MRITLKTIDDELHRVGHDVHVEKGDGYFYFWKGEANDWLDRTVNVGIPAKLNAPSEGSRTAFRDDPEHHRSVATLALRLCGIVFGFVKRNLSGAKRRRDSQSGERGAGKGGRPVPASVYRNPEREQRSAPSQSFENSNI